MGAVIVSSDLVSVAAHMLRLLWLVTTFWCVARLLYFQQNIQSQHCLYSVEIVVWLFLGKTSVGAGIPDGEMWGAAVGDTETAVTGRGTSVWQLNLHHTSLLNVSAP